MGMTHPTIVNDDGSGTTGTVWNDAWETSHDTAIDAAIAASVDVGICEGRLTLTTVVPVTTADVTAATSVKWTPYKGNRIALYNGSTAWTVLAFAETSLALGTLTSGLPYDVFAYNNSGTLGLRAPVAWANTTTRATALVLQDGVLVKTGATTDRYLGTFYTTSTTTTEDSAVKRYLWNYYNRVPRALQRFEATASWTYTTATTRQANGATANQVDVVVGWGEVIVHLGLTVTLSNTNAPVSVTFGIAEDSTTVNLATGFTQCTVAGGGVMGATNLARVPSVGRHYYAWTEYSSATGTTTWYSAIAVGNTATNGLVGWIDG